jgi:hypothetical protein
MAGENVLAVEVHQNTNTSSDVSFDFELTCAAMVRYAPALSTHTAPGVTTLRWPSDAGYLNLYYATSLAQSVWLEVTNARFWLSNQWQVALPAGTNSRRFFHLQAP